MDAPTHRALVLVVEDDTNAGRMLAKLLREDGYDVEVAEDGPTAVRRLGAQPAPDVLIVDYRLPHLDGLAVARFARQTLPDALIVMATSYPEVVAQRLRAENADAILMPKPLAYHELTRHLAAAL